MAIKANQNISFEEAAELIGGENEENTLKNIEQFILKKVKCIFK